MSDWKRTSKEIQFENLRPEMVAAIQRHVEQYNLGTILSAPLMCVQTDSEKIKKPLFGGAEIVYTGIVLTPRWLVWAVSGTKTPTAVLSAQLCDVTVQDYSQTKFAKLIADSGLEVGGRFTDASENASAFLGLDAGTVGKKFKEAAINAAQDAKK
ncbi:MAG TPA: hypothetical protein VN653_05220 [Anaerolineales bacterium]|nr:hypothetical protein [Anaerolineales bacterium]